MWEQVVSPVDGRYPWTHPMKSNRVASSILSSFCPDNINDTLPIEHPKETDMLFEPRPWCFSRAMIRLGYNLTGWLSVNSYWANKTLSTGLRTVRQVHVSRALIDRLFHEQLLTKHFYEFHQLVIIPKQLRCDRKQLSHITKAQDNLSGYLSFCWAQYHCIGNFVHDH